MHPALDWDRVRRALSQEIRKAKLSGPKRRLNQTMRTLPMLLELCGPFSQTRKMAVRIGTLLVRGPPTIAVPTCPDYPSLDGRFTPVDRLGSGVSIMTHRHIPFLREVARLIPGVQVRLLVADQEAADPSLQRATGLTHAEFLAHIDGTIEATRALVAEYGWSVEKMTAFFPDCVAAERRTLEWVLATPGFQRRIRLDAAARRDFYKLVDPHLTRKAGHIRTARNAAQYVAFGHFAAHERVLVCNHHTSNLGWYLKTAVGVLHNPVRFY